MPLHKILINYKRKKTGAMRRWQHHTCDCSAKNAQPESNPEKHQINPN